jgi:CheY-like chemotaxis protein
VDDNQDAACSIGELLRAAGFEVTTCFDGPAALAAAPVFRPDACLLDIAMPGMDGYELARQLRDRLSDHPPVFATMTAYGDYAHLERAAGAGFDLQFTKPADPREVIEQLNEGIHRNGATFAAGESEVLAAVNRKTDLHRTLTRLTNLWSDQGTRGG